MTEVKTNFNLVILILSELVRHPLRILLFLGVVLAVQHRSSSVLTTIGRCPLRWKT